MQKQIEKDLTEIFDEEYEKRVLITPQFTAERLIKKGYRKQVWHDVSTDPPKTSGLYIVCTDKGSVFTAHYYADCGRFNAPFRKSAVWWTDLPEAPREG